jgi:hypothetical protein
VIDVTGLVVGPGWSITINDLVAMQAEAILGTVAYSVGRDS